MTFACTPILPGPNLSRRLALATAKSKYLSARTLCGETPFKSDGKFLLARTVCTTDPTIALTAFARDEDRTGALVEGFNLHIAKPVEPGALVRAVADLAGHARR
jgi:hypothetical protein